MNNYPRAVYFKDGKCVGVGTSGELNDHDLMLVLKLPSDHYDFSGPVADQIIGKDLNEINNIIKEYI